MGVTRDTTGSSSAETRRRQGCRVPGRPAVVTCVMHCCPRRYHHRRTKCKHLWGPCSGPHYNNNHKYSTTVQPPEPKKWPLTPHNHTMIVNLGETKLESGVRYGFCSLGTLGMASPTAARPPPRAPARATCTTAFSNYYCRSQDTQTDKVAGILTYNNYSQFYTIIRHNLYS